MTEEFHRPARYAANQFESIQGADDPAQISRVSHETAQAILHRAREDQDPDVIDRLVTYTDEHGIDALAELWAHSSPRSLPGALWRIYLLRLLIRQDPEGIGVIFQRGTEVATTIDQVVAGAPAPSGATEVVELADRILRGVFEGDFAVALDRAAAFCRLTSAGCTSIADDSDATEPARASELTTRALRMSQMAIELTSCARLWRTESLD